MGHEHDHDLIAASLRDSRNVPEILNAAEMAMQEGRHDVAVRLAARAFNIAPDHYASARALSGFLAAIGQQDEAIHVGLRAVALNPTNAEARVHIGGLLIAAGKYRLACDHLECHALLPDAIPVGHRILSTAYTLLGMTSNALRAAQNAASADPENAEYQINLASALAARGRYGDAIGVLNRAEAKFPGDARIHRAASGIYEALGGNQMPLAIASAERAVHLAPDDQEAVAHLEQVKKRFGLMTTFGQSSPKRLSTPSKEASTSHKATLWEMLMKRVRVISALMRRDIQTKHIRSKLGYFWALFEPISHLMTLGVMFSFFNEAPPPIGDSLFLFYCTGLIPYLMFSHLSMETMNTRSGAGGLLMLPGIRQLDIVMAKAMLNLTTESLVGIIVFAAFGLAGFDSLPHHLLVVAEAVLLLWVFGIGMGLINFVIREFLHSWETWFGAIVRLLYFASGIYYSVISMPDFIRRILIWNPILQGVEIFRSGFYRDYHPTWIHPEYLSCVVIITLAIGLSLEQVSRKRIERHR
jgi:capsular polysaccharide transport system permease protein